ncbi:MAG: hypothetical protein ACE5FJ_10055 [Gemmatimonadales bacterium]
MRRHLEVAIAVLAFVGCDAPGFAPTWNVEIFFPIAFPDVVLQDELPVPILPPTEVDFTGTQETQDIDASTQEILSEDIEALSAEVVFSTPTNISGVLTISVANNPANLFSPIPNLALTVDVPLRRTPGDTITVQADVTLFKDATTLYFQSRGTARSGTGSPIAVGPDDVLRLGVNLTAEVRLVQ